MTRTYYYHHHADSRELKTELPQLLLLERRQLYKNLSYYRSQRSSRPRLKRRELRKSPAGGRAARIHWQQRASAFRRHVFTLQSERASEHLRFGHSLRRWQRWHRSLPTAAALLMSHSSMQLCHCRRKTARSQSTTSRFLLDVTRFISICGAYSPTDGCLKA